LTTSDLPSDIQVYILVHEVTDEFFLKRQLLYGAFLIIRERYGFIIKTCRTNGKDIILYAVEKLENFEKFYRSSCSQAPK